MSLIFLLVGASGAGKDSIAKELLGRVKDSSYPVSYTTRAPRPGEIDGVHYNFVTVERFKEMVDSDSFVEHAEVFGRFYGVDSRQIHLRLRSGPIIHVIDHQGANTFIKAFGHKVVVIGIFPPDLTTLSSRLVARGDSEEDIANRMKTAAADIDIIFRMADYHVINDSLPVAVDESEIIIRSYLE
jgi:guanylate kinase